MDMRRPSAPIVFAAEIWAGEQSWYSFSGRLKAHSGIFIFSIGALIIALKLESTSSFAIFIIKIFYGEKLFFKTILHSLM